MRSVLAITAGVVAIIVVLVYWRVFFRTERVESAEELAQKALTAATPKEQETAAVRLSQLGKPARQHQLRVFKESEQPEVRAACIRGFAEQWAYSTLPDLFGALEDPSDVVRAQAGAAVEHLLRVEYGYRANDPEPQRRATVNKLHARWESAKQSAMYKAFLREKGEEP